MISSPDLKELIVPHLDNDDPLDGPAFGSQYGLMSGMVRFVSRDDYRHALTDSVRLDKYPRFYAHMNDKFALSLPPRDRTVLKKMNLSVPQLLTSPVVDIIDGEPHLAFILVSDRPLEGEPNLRPVAAEFGRGHRPLVWRGRYVLTKRPTGQWTWHMTDDLFAKTAENLLEEVDRGRADRVHALLSRLTRLPLFHGVTKDARKLIRHASSSWAHRTRRHAGPATEKQLNVVPYLAATRPRRGVGGRLYARHADGSYKTLRDLLHELEQKHGGEIGRA
jgi:hypothetical protein